MTVSQWYDEGWGQNIFCKQIKKAAIIQTHPYREVQKTLIEKTAAGNLTSIAGRAAGFAD